MAVNTNTGVADLRQDVLRIDQNVSKIGQDMSKLRGDAGSQNEPVSETFRRFSIHTNRSAESE